MRHHGTKAAKRRLVVAQALSIGRTAAIAKRRGDTWTTGVAWGQDFNCRCILVPYIRVKRRAA